MAKQVNFGELLDKKYASFTVEVNAFLNSCEISSSTDIAMDVIYQAIKDDENVDKNLKRLYHEAIFGNGRNVKARIRSRITHFRRTLRPHPKVQQIDMLHASDYANMNVQQVTKKMKENKKKDDSVRAAMQCEHDCKRKAEKETMRIPTAEDSDSEVYWCMEEDCWKDKKCPKLDEKEPTDLPGNNDSDNNLPNKDHALKGLLTKSGISKKTCTSLVRKSAESDDNQEAFSAGPCSSEFHKKQQMETKMMNFEGNGSESENSDDNSGKLKTYGKDKLTMNKKKLIPKKVQQRQLPTKMESKAEKEFKKIINKKKVDPKGKDISFSSDEDTEKISSDLKVSFNEKAKRSDIEKEELNTMFAIRDCTNKVGKSGLETTAYLCALAETKGLNMEKHRGVVEKEMQQDSKKKEDEHDPLDDQDEFVALPDMNDSAQDIFGADPSLWINDNQNSPLPSVENEELVKDDSPFYANQLEDPESVEEMNYWLNQF